MAISDENYEALKSSWAKSESVFFSASNLDIVFKTHILSVKPDILILFNSVPPEYISRVVGSSYYFLQVGMVRFDTQKIESDGCNVVFPINDLTPIKETRSAKRFLFTDDEQVIAEFTNPFDGSTLIKKQVFDMSSDGLSLISNFDSLLFQPGLEIDPILVRVDGEKYRECAAKVVYNRKYIDQKGDLKVQIGLSFD